MQAIIDSCVNDTNVDRVIISDSQGLLVANTGISCESLNPVALTSIGKNAAALLTTMRNKDKHHHKSTAITITIETTSLCNANDESKSVTNNYYSIQHHPASFTVMTTTQEAS